MQDLKNNISIATSLAPAARTASANGTGVDLSGFDSAVAVITPGAITDGTHTPKLQESDDDTTYTDVGAADLIGSFAAIAANTNQKVGYIGAKRFIRVVSTVAGATNGGVYGATVIRGHARNYPIA